MKARIIDTNEIFEVKEVYLKGNPNYPFEIDFCLGEKSIRELSKEYSECMCPPEDYYDNKERNTDLSIYQEDATCVLKWLGENYEVKL